MTKAQEKSFPTGVVAKMFGLTARQVAKMVDRGEIDGHMVESKLQRRSTRRIPLRALVEFMISRKISANNVDGEVDVHRALWRRQVDLLEEAIDKAKKRGDLFLKIGSSADILLEICKNLGSLENLKGVARKNSWAKVFRAMAETIEQHTRACIAHSKK